MGKIIENKYSGETIIFIQTTEETNGKIFQFKWIVKPGGAMPFVHIHPDQEECLEVVSGECGLWLKGERKVILAGQKIVIPRGVPHRPYNHSQKYPLEVIATFTPALDVQVAFETIFNLARDGRVNKKGKPSLLQMIVIQYVYPTAGYLPYIPIWVQSAVVKLLGPIGLWLGYKAKYE